MGASADGPTETAVPYGTRVVLDRHARTLDGGRVLLGGAPPRMLHLLPAAQALLRTGGFTVVDPTSVALARRLLDVGIAHPAPTPPGMSSVDVTGVVPVKDRSESLRRLLAALPGARVIVVDDGSVAGAIRVAGATVIRHEQARGPAAARNAGLAAATTPLVAFLDSDVVPEPGWLEPLLAQFADPAVGLAAPRIVALDPGDGWLQAYEAVRSSLDLGPDPALIVPRSRVAYVPSAAMVVRRDAVGTGFDETMQVAEDVDLVLRLHAAGWRMRYEPASRVAHDHRTGGAQWWTRKVFYGTGAAPLALRHPGSVPPMVLSPWSAAVGVLVLLIGLGMIGAVAQTADAVTRHYWPLAAVACVVSRRARRTVAVVGLAEGVVDWWRHRDRDPRVRSGLPAHVLAHRLDDLAYGTGLWWGAAVGRTIAPLRPTVTGVGRPAGGPGRVGQPSLRASPNE